MGKRPASKERRDRKERRGGIREEDIGKYGKVGRNGGVERKRTRSEGEEKGKRENALNNKRLE